MVGAPSPALVAGVLIGGHHRELCRRLSRIAETVVAVAERVWYAAVKEMWQPAAFTRQAFGPGR